MTVLLEVPTSSEYCQRWRGGAHSFRHPSDARFDPQRYTVEPVDEATAKAYVMANHYSGTYCSAKYRYGLYDHDQLVGVMVLGSPMKGALTTVLPDLEPFYESIGLERFVLDDDVPANGESWFLARGFEIAAAAGVRGVVSAADPVPRRVNGQVVFPGHIGTIYQATNSVYTGRQHPRTKILLPTGEVFDEQAMGKIRQQKRGHDYAERKLVAMGARPLRLGEDPKRWLADALDAVGARRFRHRGNHRYVFRLGNKSQRRAVRIAVPAFDYPKERDAA